MNVESAAGHSFTPKQLENQRLFNVGSMAMPEQSGDKAKRVGNKLAILTAATAADLGESWVTEKLLDSLNHKLTHGIEDPQKLAQRQAVFFGAGFVEDAVSDDLYSAGMNALLRGMTGVEDASYASPTSKFISGWVNLGSYASGRFQNTVDMMGNVVKKMPVWKKPWNVVNAVNTEAAIGLLEEMPLGIGKAVSRAHAFADRKISGSEAFQLIDGTAKAFVAGYNIMRNMVHDSRPVQQPAQPPAA